LREPVWQRLQKCRGSAATTMPRMAHKRFLRRKSHVKPSHERVFRSLSATLGVVLAVIALEFPFSGSLSLCAPGRMGGNAASLNHASRCAGCAQSAIDKFSRKLPFSLITSFEL